MHAPVAVDFGEGAQQRVDAGRDLRRGAERAAARRRAGAVEIEGDLVAHDAAPVRSTFSASGDGAASASLTITLERRLQRMGEIADLRAGALENVAIGADQKIEFVGERRDLAGVGAGDAIALAAADRDELALQ